MKEYLLDLDSSYFNQYNSPKLSTYPLLLSLLATKHLKSTDQKVGEAIQDKYAWVLTAMKIDLKAPIDLKELLGVTWYGGSRGPFYRREYQLFKDDKVYLEAASYSVLLDLETRKVFRGKNLPFEELPLNETKLVALKTSFRETIPFYEVYQGKVTNSDLDLFNHVNNLKYSEICYDALTLEEVKALKRLTSIDLYFQKEMKLADLYSVNKAVKNNKIYLNIINLTTNTNSFTMVLEF